MPWTRTPNGAHEILAEHRTSPRSAGDQLITGSSGVRYDAAQLRHYLSFGFFLFHRKSINDSTLASRDNIPGLWWFDQLVTEKEGYERGGSTARVDFAATMTSARRATRFRPISRPASSVTFRHFAKAECQSQNFLEPPCSIIQYNSTGAINETFYRLLFFKVKFAK